MLIRLGMQHAEEMCYRYFKFCPPCVKIVTILPCKIRKSYFISSQHCQKCHWLNMKHAMSSVRVTARNVLLLHQLRHRVFATGQLFRVILSSTSAIYLLQPVSECGRLVPALLPKYGNQPTARTSVLLTLKVLESTCDVGYLCANFGLLRPLWCPVRPDVRDRRQTASSLNGRAPYAMHLNWAEVRMPQTVWVSGWVSSRAVAVAWMDQWAGQLSIYLA